MAKEHQVTLLHTGFVTHDVKRYIVSKPDGFAYVPGQACEVSIDLPGLTDDKRPLTLTSRPGDKVLEFTVKSYHDHNGMTHAMWDLQPGATLHISDVFGAIHYVKPGLFLAAGTGITPFLSIFRDLWSRGELHQCSLLFSNKTKADIIHEHELTHYFSQVDNGLLLTLTRKSSIGYVSGRITEAIVKEFCPKGNCFAYICGPKPFVAAMKQITKDVGMESDEVITEK